MSKLSRKTFKRFGSNVYAGADIGQFGSKAAGSPAYTTDIATIQSLSAWLTGFADADAAGNTPYQEDVMAVFYVFAYMIFCMLESGIPDYDAGTTYYIGSYVQVNGDLYKSRVDNNVGHTPASSPTQWSACIDMVDGGVKVGAMMPYAGSSAPAGYLICDGSAVSRSTYAALFAICSTNYGVGNGTTTFNIPDLRQRIPVGYKSGDSDFGSLGATAGEKTHTLSTSEIPKHIHGIDLYSPNNGGNSGVPQNTPGPSDGSTTTGETGGGGAHNNLQPSLTINYIIKT